jgi:hypothetical protein
LLLRPRHARAIFLFRKGANFTAALVFELAATSLVAELGIIIVLLGWQFAAAEFLGAQIMVVILVMLFQAFLTSRMVDEARHQADKGIRGSMEGHAEMDMSVTGGPLPKRILSTEGRTAMRNRSFIGHGCF